MCIKLPSLNPSESRAKGVQERIYLKWMATECAPLDRLCKVLASPTDSVLPVLAAMSSPQVDVDELMRICTIRGLGPKEQIALVEAYNATAKSSEQRIPVEKLKRSADPMNFKNMLDKLK